jgi:asparagine synthase (glutamine-hydrolysing)
MCGITTIFAYHKTAPPVDQEELLRIRERMYSRGPDGAGLWISENSRIGLAHRRLAIIDLSQTGAQPMSTPDGKLRIVFNGEIYNYRELRKDLEKAGYRFISTSDTEVLLHLYRRQGREMVHLLRGMYAFALWDEEKRGLLLARDPFGIKPLYYADDGRTIRVASQVKALLKGYEIDTNPEPAGHVGFYLWGHVPEPYTLYRGVRALPAGATLWVDTAGHKEIRQFFNLTEELAKTCDTLLSITREEMLVRLHDALLDSVRCHLIADVPIGVFLSAGRDSSTIVALAREAGMDDLHTITLGFREFQGTPNDETKLAEMVAHHYGTLHQTCWVAKEDFLREYSRFLEAMDQPSTDGVNSYFISKAAKDVGLKVVLSGLGGDELYGGYPSFHQIPSMAKVFAPFRSIPSFGKGFRYLSAPILKHFTSPKYAGILEYGNTHGGAYLLRRGMFMPWELPDLLGGEMVQQGWEELQTLLRLEQTTQGVNNDHLKVTALETTWYMRNQLLRDTDWASMAHSLEMRVPLVDIELFRAMVPLLNSSFAPNKRLMAEAPQLPLPSEVLVRSKTGFSVPMQEWFLRANYTSSEKRGLRGWALTLHKPYKRWRILALLTDAFGGIGGIAKFNRDLLTAIADHPNVSIVNVLPRIMPFQPDNIPGKIVYVTEAVGGKAKYLKAFFSTLSRGQPFDLVICGHINLLPLARLAGIIAKAPVLLITHGIDAWQPTKNRLTNYVVTKVNQFISVSELTKQRFSNWTGLPQGLGWLLPNCFEPQDFTPGTKSPSLLRRYGLEGKLVLMTCGRMTSTEMSKGFDRIIQLLPTLIKKIPNIAYLIVGDGDDRPHLESMARQLRVDDRVVFAGYVSEAEKADHYRLADVYVMPSRGEGFGIVYLEAMACGIPVVGSGIDGSREALRDGMLGILVDPDSPDDIKRGILEALGRPRGVVPEGLTYFSYDNFELKCHRIIDRILTPVQPIYHQ